MAGGTNHRADDGDPRSPSRDARLDADDVEQVSVRPIRNMEVRAPTREGRCGASDPNVQAQTKGRRQEVHGPDAAAGRNVLPGHLLPMVRFALSTGLRDANVRGLLWEDVDLGRRVA